MSGFFIFFGVELWYNSSFCKQPWKVLSRREPHEKIQQQQQKNKPQKSPLPCAEQTISWATSLSLLTSSWPHTLCSPRAHLGGSPFIALQIFLSQGRPRGHDATACMLWSLQSLFFSESRVLLAAEDLHPPGEQLDYKAQWPRGSTGSSEGPAPWNWDHMQCSNPKHEEWLIPETFTWLLLKTPVIIFF